MKAAQGQGYPKREGRQRTVLDDFLWCVRDHPQRTALVSYFASGRNPVSLTYEQMGRLVDRLAIKFLELGVEPREFVSFQFPNRWEFVIAHLATIRIGAISNPIMPTYGKRELRFMLDRTKSNLCLALKRYKRTEPGAVLDEIKNELDTFKHLILIDDAAGPGSLESQLADIEVNDEVRRRLDQLKPGADDLEVIHFSSGTTGEPKGILHTFNSIFRCITNVAKPMSLSEKDVILMSSPLAHATGSNYGVEMPLILGCKCVLQESWDAEQMLRIVEKERVTWSMGSSAFVRDACDAAEGKSFDLSSFRVFTSGGAPIPPQLVSRTAKFLGAQLIPCWGMSEAGATTLGKLTDSEERRSTSDGAPAEGVDVRVVDDDGKPVPPNTSGHLQVRSPGQHVGYFMNDELYRSSFQDGWFKTGDLGKMDECGYVRIVGRSKDLVIRGGENIPIIEIENILLEHPGIADIAIVGVPNDRLGECCHAVVVPRRAGHELTLRDLTSHLEARGVTKQYWPEFISMAEALPRTGSGKIQRYVVRDSVLGRGRV